MTKYVLSALFLVSLAGCAQGRTSCIRSTDCTESEQCINGFCFPEGTDAGVGVSACDECISGWVCQEGRCTPGCDLTGCAPGLNCDPTSDLCVSTPVCLETEDCSTDSDDDCDGMTSCDDSDCAGRVCDDGVWCNGADQCMDGVCQATGVSPCEDGACDEAMDRCGECTMDADCGGTTMGAWGDCSYDGTCDASGTRTRMVTRHQCVSGMCMTTTSPESDASGCARSTQNTSCGSNSRCFDGRCAPRCGTGNDGSVDCSMLCNWCGGSCAAAEIQSSGAIESCGHRGERMWCYCNGI